MVLGVVLVLMLGFHPLRVCEVIYVCMVNLVGWRVQLRVGGDIESRRCKGEAPTLGKWHSRSISGIQWFQ